MRYILIVILVVGVLAAFGLLDFDKLDTNEDMDTTVSTSTSATSSSDETEDLYADWQLYQNDDAGYELRYPPVLSEDGVEADSDTRFSNTDESVVLDIITRSVGSGDTLRSVLSEETSRLNVVTGADIGTSTAWVGGRLAGGANQDIKILVADQVIIARLTYREDALSAAAAAEILASLRRR